MGKDVSLRTGKITAKNFIFSGGLVTAGGNGPSSVYSVEIDGIKTLLTSLHSRAIAEALREVIQTKLPSEWKHEYKGIFLSIGFAEEYYFIRLSFGEEAKYAYFDKWEIRAVLKQIEHFVDITEEKVYDFIWKISASSIK